MKVTVGPALPNLTLGRRRRRHADEGVQIADDRGKVPPILLNVGRDPRKLALDARQPGVELIQPAKDMPHIVEVRGRRSGAPWGLAHAGNVAGFRDENKPGTLRKKARLWSGDCVSMQERLGAVNARSANTNLPRSMRVIL